METQKTNTKQPPSTCSSEPKPTSRRATTGTTTRTPTVDITKTNPPQPYSPMSIFKREKRWEQVFDVDGSLWEVREARATKYGFDLLFGYPGNSHIPPKLIGPARLIDTPALVNFWETHRTEEGYIYDLPAGRSTIKRARRRLKLNLREDRRNLWKKRATDLKTLATNEFAERYNVSSEVTNAWRYLFFGRSARPLDWWQHPEALAVLRNKELKLREIGVALKIGTSHANRLRARAAQIDPALLEKKVEAPVPTPLFDRPFRSYIRSPFLTGRQQGEFFAGQKEFWRPSPKPAAKADAKPFAAEPSVPKTRKPQRGMKYSHSLEGSRRTGQMLLPFKPRRGPEPKPVLFQVQDHEGTFYDVFDSRPTKYGFNLLFGFPARWHRRIFTKFGKPGLIHTPELIAFWEEHRGEIRINLDLPAGHTTLVRARMKLGFNQFDDYEAQWVERIPELKSLPAAEIAKKYNVKVPTVKQWRKALLGKLPHEPKLAA
jgi:hypothetical protein